MAMRRIIAGVGEKWGNDGGRWCAEFCKRSGYRGSLIDSIDVILLSAICGVGLAESIFGVDNVSEFKLISFV